MTTRATRSSAGPALLFAIFTWVFLATPDLAWSGHPSPVCPGLGNPHATLTVWETQPVLGFDPTEAVEDPLSLSGYFSGADGPTLVTAYENTFCNNLPCGLTWWAPDINRFRCMGFGFGTNTAISLDNGSADIVLPDQNEGNDPFTPGGPFDHVGLNVGAGSVWTFGITTCPVAVTLRGDQSGADGAGGTGGVARTRAWPVDLCNKYDGFRFFDIAATFQKSGSESGSTQFHAALPSVAGNHKL